MDIKDQKKEKENFLDRAFKFSIQVIELTDSLPSVRSCWVIADQLIRSATSIGANITEAKSASSKRDYINFYTHALKSANEAKYWLTLLKETKRVPSEKINPLIDEVEQLANILAASIITMKKNR